MKQEISVKTKSEELKVYTFRKLFWLGNAMHRHTTKNRGMKSFSTEKLTDAWTKRKFVLPSLWFSSSIFRKVLLSRSLSFTSYRRVQRFFLSLLSCFSLHTQYRLFDAVLLLRCICTEVYGWFFSIFQWCKHQHAVLRKPHPLQSSDWSGRFSEFDTELEKGPNQLHSDFSDAHQTSNSFTHGR